MTRLIRSRSAKELVGVLQHDDVAVARIVEVVAQLVDDDAVTRMERAHHRLTVDGELLHDERSQQQCRADRHDGDHDQSSPAPPAAPSRRRADWCRSTDVAVDDGLMTRRSSALVSAFRWARRCRTRSTACVHQSSLVI